jgi:hypothetical protein
MKRMQRIICCIITFYQNLCSAHHLEHRQRDVLARAFVGVSQGDTKCRGMSCDLYRFSNIAAWVNGATATILTVLLLDKTNNIH